MSYTTDLLNRRRTSVIGGDSGTTQQRTTTGSYTSQLLQRRRQAIQVQPGQQRKQLPPLVQPIAPEPVKVSEPGLFAKAGKFLKKKKEQIFPERKKFELPSVFKTVNLPSGQQLKISKPTGLLADIDLEPAKLALSLDSKADRELEIQKQKIKEFYSTRFKEVRKQTRLDIADKTRSVRPDYEEPGIFGSVIESIKEATLGLGSSLGATLEMHGVVAGNIGLTAIGHRINKEADQILASNPEWREAPDAKWSPTKVARLVAGAVPSILATIGATMLAGPQAGFAVGYGAEAGGTYKEALDFGVPEEDAQKYGFMVGTVNGLLESLFPADLLDKKKITREATKKISKSMIKNLLRKAGQFGVKFGKGGALEGPTEALQQLWSNIIATSYDEDRKLWDGLLEAFVGGFGAGGISGATLDQGEYTPREVIDQVINSPLENTPEGKKLIINALEAEKQGNNIIIGPKEEVSVVEDEKLEEEDLIKERQDQEPIFDRELDQKEYDEFIKDKLETARSQRQEGEVTVIQTGTGEYVDTVPEVAVDRGANKDTKVFNVDEKLLKSTEDVARDERGERLIDESVIKKIVEEKVEEVKELTEQDILIKKATEFDDYVKFHNSLTEQQQKELSGGKKGILALESSRKLWEEANKEIIEVEKKERAEFVEKKKKTAELVKEAKVKKEIIRLETDVALGKTEINKQIKKIKKELKPLLDKEDIFDSKGNITQATAKRQNQIQIDLKRISELEDALKEVEKPLKGLLEKKRAELEKKVVKPTKEAKVPTRKPTQIEPEAIRVNPPKLKKDAKKPPPGFKESKVIERVKDTLQAEVDLSETIYKTLTLDGIAERAVDIVNKQPDLARDIISGFAPVPQGTTKTGILIASAEVARKAGDFKTQKDLIIQRSFMQTRHGQEIVTEKLVNSLSSDRFIRDVLKVRMNKVIKKSRKALEVAHKFSDKVTKQAKGANKKVNKKVLSKIASAQQIIDDLIC